MRQIIIDGIEYTLTPKNPLAEMLYNDWRLPTIKELATLINYTKHNPASDLEDTVYGNYWTSTIDNGSTGNAWVVNFYKGYQSSINKSSRSYVRCVRDSKHGIQWSKSQNELDWYKAIELAKELVAPVYKAETTRIKSELDLLKEKYLTGKYICIYRVPGSNIWDVEANPMWVLAARDYKLIRKEHRQVLEAYLEDDSVGIEVWYGEDYALVRNGFIETYDESADYIITKGD